MPTYDYQCKQCGHEFEAFQSMRDDLLKKCPECGESSLERLIGTGAGIIFKGGGFYETDYKKSSQGEKADTDKGNSGKSDKSSSKQASETSSKKESTSSD